MWQSLIGQRRYWLLAALIVPVMIYAASQLLPAISGWITFERHCENLKASDQLADDINCAVAAPYVTRRSELGLFGNYSWAGLTSHVYYDSDTGTVTAFKARVAIVNSDSPYDCGKAIVIDAEDAKEVQNRSLRHWLCE